MTSLSTIGLLAVLAMAAQKPAEMPAAWERKYEAAEREVKAGAFARAEVLMLEVVAEAEKLGAEDLRVATPLGNLGAFYLMRKRSAEAEPLLRRALAIREKAQGPDHPDVANALVSLAMCRMIREQKEAETAAPMLRRALAILEKSKGKDSPDLAKALQCLVTMHALRGEIGEAETTLTRLLAIREKASGPNSREVATVLDDLGDLYTEQADSSTSKDFDAKLAGIPKEEWQSERYGRKAEGFYTRSLAIREKALKADHPDIAESLYNLGQLAMIRHRLADGEQYLERWLRLQEAAKSPASKKQAEACFVLAEACKERKDWAGADRWRARAQSIYEALNGVESHEVSMELAGRSDIAIKAGRFDDAEKHLKRGLDIQAALLGPEDPDVAEARRLMGRSYRDHVDDRRAPVLWHRLHLLKERTDRKRDHWNLGEILDGYASLLRRTNRVVPQPTEEDLAYLKKAGAVLAFVDLGYFANQDSLLDTNLDDAGLKHVARLYEIERLSLRGAISDAGLPHVRGLLNLRDLSLSNSRVTNAGLANVTGLENLEELNVMMTRVDDAGLAQLKGLKKLRRLNLALTNVTDAGLSHVEGLESLRSLDIKGTRITDDGVRRLRRARPDLQVEYEAGEGFMQLTVPAGFRPGGPPDVAVPARPVPAALPPPALPPGKP